MSLGFISYSKANDKAVQKLLDSARAVSDDLTPLFETLAGELRKSRKAIFKLKSAGGYPNFKGPKVSETWKKPGRPDMRTRQGNLSAYQNTKLKHFGFMYPLLRATGDLESSITEKGDSNHIARATRKDLVFGTKIEYAKYHQGDAGKGKGIIPLRKFLFIGPDTKRMDDTAGGFARIKKTIEITILREMGMSLDEARKAVANG